MKKKGLAEGRRTVIKAEFYRTGGISDRKRPQTVLNPAWLKKQRESTLGDGPVKSRRVEAGLLAMAGQRTGGVLSCGG